MHIKCNNTKYLKTVHFIQGCWDLKSSMSEHSSTRDIIS